MATSQGGLRIMSGEGKEPAAEQPALVITGAGSGSAVAASSEVDAAPAAPAPEAEAPPPPRLKVERVDNVMGSQAGAGSSDFHIYRRHAKTEMRRQERMEADDQKKERDEEHARRVETKRKECDARTAKNAAKRRKKKDAKAKRDAIQKGAGGHAFEDDGSFMAKAKALAEAKE